MLELITLPYARPRWSGLLRQLFENYQENAVPREIDVPGGGLADSIHQLGTVTIQGGQEGETITLAVIEISARNTVELLRNRVGIRNLAARLLAPGTADGLLIATIQPGNAAWRFTFVHRETRFTAEGNLERVETPTRRFTYVLGPNESCRTPGSRFELLATRRGETTIAHVLDAFSVEKLSDEFFTTYERHYADFCVHLIENTDLSEVLGIEAAGLEGKELDRALKPIRDFVKKLLGRLVFLHFIQKKGWLGCPALLGADAALPQESMSWTGGSPDFLREMFRRAPSAEQESFHSSHLVPLFFHTLNAPNREGLIFPITGSRVPYLNGGLFEPDFPGVEAVDFPARLFEGLLEFFSQYHFTIDENDPEDHEIGIDPEMLGRIFENLLEDNKDKGAYYTPKPVVQYMCQQSLIHSLTGRYAGDAEAPAQIERLVRLKEPVNAMQNSWLALHATDLSAHLDDLRICDPAIGSGAFPIGLLQEIYWTKLTLNPSLDRAQAKRGIIQHSIHGVDLDSGAVEIARLRFWLALIVEETVPTPLPNLDYQIMQGNSLMESFEGERLDQLAEPIRAAGRQRLGSDVMELDLGGTSSPGELTLTIHTPAQHNLAELREEYYACHDPVEKAALRGRIDSAMLQAIDARLTLRREELVGALQNWDREIARKRSTHRNYQPGARELRKHEKMQDELDSLAGKSARLHTLLENPRSERPFFLWHLWFRLILAAPPEGRGGFDIMIANPPYGAHIPHADVELIRAQFNTLANSLDTFIVFMEQASRLLRPTGVLSFIIPCGWVSTPSCRKLRDLFARLFHPRVFASLPYDVFGDAYVDTMIVVGSRLELEDGWNAIEDKAVDLVVFPVRHRIFEISDFDRFHKATDFGLWGNPAQDGFLVTSNLAESNLIAKIRRLPNKFDDFVEVMRGIETFNPQSTPPPQSKHAFVGDIYRYEINHTGVGYISYPPGIERGKPWRFFSGPRVLLRQLLSRRFRLQAGYAEDDFLTNQSVQSIVARDDENSPLKVMLAILNSSLISWYFCQINMVSRRDDFPKTIIKVTRELPVPDIREFNSGERDGLIVLVNRILAAKRVGEEAEVREIEAQIDRHVFDLYGLTSQEIAVIESSLT